MPSFGIGTSRIAGWAWALLSMVAVGSGCGGKGGERGLPTPAEPLRVAAASDLQPALADLEAGFKRASGRAVQFVVGSSGQLSAQIKQGAPFDVFLSADREYVQALAKEGAVDSGSVKAYAVGTLVLALRKESAEIISALEDLSKPEVKRIAIANPEHAPYGRAARQALQEAGLWGSIEPKIVLAESVRQALQFVESGNADAGFVGSSGAIAAKLETRPVPQRLYDPIVQGLGLISTTKQRENAQAFVDFLLSSEGQEILRTWGFGPGRPGGARPDKEPAPEPKTESARRDPSCGLLSSRLDSEFLGWPGQLVVRAAQPQGIYSQSVARTLVASRPGQRVVRATLDDTFIFSGKRGTGTARRRPGPVPLFLVWGSVLIL